MSTRETELTPEAVRAALSRAERQIRLNYVELGVLFGFQAVILGVALKVADLSQPTHLLLILATAFLWLQMFLLASLLSARNDAMNARILRGLELLEESRGQE